MKIIYEEDNIVYEPRFMELKLNEIHFYDSAEDVKKGELKAYIFEYKTNEDAKRVFDEISKYDDYFVKADDDTILSYDFPYWYSKPIM